MTKYIAYYRVSTKQQGNSGLGLSAQKQMINNFIKDDSEVIHEFTEVESGTNCNRPVLNGAIERCKETGATLLIAKLDRLSRNSVFILTLKESGVKFVAADMPDANSMTIGILAILAEDEAKKISERTQLALNEIKTKLANGKRHVSKSGNVIKSLGNPDNLSHKDRLKGAETMARKAKENPDNRKAGAFIISLISSGESFYSVTKRLNEHGFKTPRGNKFTQVQTKRLYNRYA